jgi:hypothetical protein
MKSRFHKIKMKLLSKSTNPQSILFHVVGLACIIWFLVRVLPKPDRIRYPCQQLSMTVASGYIIFWMILWGAVFHGLAFWVKRVKTKTAAFIPVLLVSFILIFTISSNVFAVNYQKETEKPTLWDPITKEPMGTPKGANPGRVVWIWDPDATESNLKGFWWEKQNNNQEVLDEMFSNGIKALAGINDGKEAWDVLFSYFNEINGNGEIGYQPGEKIAIKVNLNNNWGDFAYYKIDNARDASPYVVKSLLRQLIDIVGVAQEDITVYDASRKMPNWFYKRVYYQSYPSFPLIKEFPNVNFEDLSGSISGRNKVIPSSELIYFSDGSGLYKTLPTCVVDADYIINMPLLKRHPIDFGVTLSAKNFFGTWIEPVFDVHSYHTAGFTEGSPTPQTDLLAHKHIGGKTFLYVGDGTFATKIDHATIGKFEMYPFNNDWTNSLFFSQDPVAIDSVMYDFLYTEGTNPCEGSQNYLHQSAVPNPNTYDPENDGVYLSESLGVHEHWDITFDIFSTERYSGISGNGIDFVVIGNENANPAVIISKPMEDYLYINNDEKIRIRTTIVFGNIDVIAKVNGVSEEIEKVEFYVDNNILHTVFEEPYICTWGKTKGLINRLKVIAYYGEAQTLEKEISVIKIN